MKTIATLQGDVLDIREYDFKTREELVEAVRKQCERYHTWAPSCIPDILVMTPEQRKLLPEGDFMYSGYNVMEIQVKSGK